MNRIFVSDHGIQPDTGRCCADTLTALIAQNGDDCEIIFPAGVYYLEKRVQVTGKHRLTLRGENAVIRIHFRNTDVQGLDGAFGFTDCESLTLKGFKFDTDVSPNIAGSICAVDTEKGYFDVRFFDEFPLTGNERLEAINTVDSELTPDYRFVTYNEVPHLWLGGNTYRFEAEAVGADLEKLPVGTLINIRHCKYGAPVAVFSNVNGALIEDITIISAPGCVFVINPRCADFTFNRYNIRLPENTKRLMASNADGIHIAGLTGSLVMKDCYFADMGDDALNIHSKAGMVTAMDDNGSTLTCHAVRPVTGKDPSMYRDGDGDNILYLQKSPMHPEWVRPGDLLYVYDQKTLRKDGEIRVKRYEDTAIDYEVVSGSVHVGSVLANAAYYASVHIDGCTVRNTRARAFVLQSNNIVVENCHIFGMAFNAFLLSPDISYWYEVGPCENVTIRGNRIEKCSNSTHRSNIGAIVLKCRHEEGISNSPAGVHKHIRILDNTFINTGNCGVFALAVRDLQVCGNRFINCNNNPFDDGIELLKYDVSMVNCEEVRFEGNTSDKDAAHHLFCKAYGDIHR